jgi:D-beta-D-heptose 7-phosphate kinase/D-beta-D-heptose 1-phosphate adenosyltransferase
MADTAGKIRPQAALAATLAGLRRRGIKVVFTNGCFDIIHAGHVKYLAMARRLGDVLVVGLNSDASVRALKGRGRPLNSAPDRAEVLAGLGCVDFVTVFGERTPERLIMKLKPDVLAKGSDWKASDIAGADFVRGRGGRVALIPFVRGRSTTALIRKARRTR